MKIFAYAYCSIAAFNLYIVYFLINVSPLQTLYMIMALMSAFTLGTFCDWDSDNWLPRFKKIFKDS